ncbi:MAG: hypothetical protein QM594_13705 [Niabella sp.]
MNKNILQLTFTCLLIALLLGSCTKKEDVLNKPGKYYIKFKANGVEKKLDMIPSSITSFYSSALYESLGYHIYEFGMASAQFKELMHIGIFTPSALAKKTYTDNSGGLLPEALLTYSQAPLDGSVYFSSMAYDDGGFQLKKDCKITITEMNDTEIQGTFSGTVYFEKDDGDPDRNKAVTITDGSFYVQADLQ